MKILSLETFKLGLNNLRLHKLRSLLTSLGIIFGVAAVICMLSVSEGANADEMRMYERLGTRNVIVNSVKPPQSGLSTTGNTNLIEYGITREDVSVIEATIPHLARVVPLKTIAYRARRGEFQTELEVVGTTPEFFNVVDIEISRGRSLSPADLTERLNVCVIGERVRRELFPFTDPIGETIQVDRHPSSVPFTVVGILGEVQTAGAPARGVQERNLNRDVYVPLSTASTQFSDTTRRIASGSREFIKMQYSGLYLQIEDTQYVEAVAPAVTRVFEHKHRQVDYDIKVPLALLKALERKQRNNKLTLGLIAGISLLVGGIGIMNIMLATVTERTREIGIRRALGARQRHIATQFLVETVVLSTAGGLLGVALGVAGAHVVTRFAQWETVITVWSVAVSFGLSVLIGIFFGMYPALTAARLDPIEALRHE